MMYPSWKLYFYFSKKELKGVLVLGIILFGSVLLSKLFPAVKNNAINSQAESIVRLFPFDPNQIDSVSAIKLGIPPKQVKSLLHYRSKGGYFKNEDDFARLYGLSPNLFKTLRPYIKMTVPHGPYNNPHYYKTAGSYDRIYNNKDDVKHKLDINTANENEWLQKTKIPLSTIQRIIHYRQYLGAFTTVSQLSKVYGMPDSIFQQLRLQAYVKAGQNNLMNASAMGFSEWKKLGFFSDKQIWAILKIRKENSGKIGWVDLIEACDLSQAEAEALKLKLRLSD